MRTRQKLLTNFGVFLRRIHPQQRRTKGVGLNSEPGVVRICPDPLGQGSHISLSNLSHGVVFHLLKLVECSFVVDSCHGVSKVVLLFFLSGSSFPSEFFLLTLIAWVYPRVLALFPQFSMNGLSRGHSPLQAFYPGSRASK